MLIFVEMLFVFREKTREEEGNEKQISNITSVFGRTCKSNGEANSCQ
jgi:hypothetical protein